MSIGVIAFEIEDITDIGTAELVNGLIVIADNADIAVVAVSDAVKSQFVAP